MFTEAQARISRIGLCPRTTAKWKYRGALRRTWPLLAALFAASGVIAALQLAASLTPLAVYDTVLPSRSLLALASVVCLALSLYLLFTILDFLRARVLYRAGLDFVRVLERGALAPSAPEGQLRLERLADVEHVARFLTQSGPAALVDVLWLPAWLIAAAVLHPALGVYSGGVVLLLIGLALSGERPAHKATHGILETQRQRHALALGMLGALPFPADGAKPAGYRRRWRALSRFHYGLTAQAAEHALAARALGKGVRLMLQSAGLGLATLLVIDGSIGPGGLVASSLILGRTFALLDAALAHWRSFVAARDSYSRLLPFCPLSRGRIRS